MSHSAACPVSFQDAIASLPGLLAAEEPDRLESWKEIAEFIGCDVRTAMRWAARQGMPVHRVPGGKLGRVFASRKGITQWFGNRAGDPSEGTQPAGNVLRRKWVLAVALGALAFVASEIILSSHRSNIAPQRLGRL